MACCVGVKRPCPDLDSVSTPPPAALTPKRRRPLASGSPPACGSNLPLGIQQQHQKILFSPFGGEANVPELRSEAIANQIREEMKRFQNRRQLNFSNNDCNGNVASPSVGFIGSQNSDDNNRPLFTFDQVHQICGRMLQDRETVLREHFQKILTAKLDEQYETFVKFAQDQLRGLAVSSAPASEEPSYLS